MVYEFTATDDNTFFFGLHLVSSDDYRYVLNAHGDVVALVNATGNVERRNRFSRVRITTIRDKSMAEFSKVHRGEVGVYQIDTQTYSVQY